jgi:alpha-glucoside transport system substrate-binding protein
LRGLAAGVLAFVLCVALAGCGGGTEPETTAGDTIEIFGPYRGVEADRFMETLQPFADRAGVDIRYVGSQDFVEDLRRRVGEGNDPPDLAVVPQPGLIRQLAADGDIVRPGQPVADAVAADYSPAAADLGRIDGTLFAVPFRLTVKSLVWYRPEVFAANGWKPPRTLADLDRLAARIASESGLAPWCFGISAGSATGWAATDWTEDLVLRTAGPALYRRWVAGAVGFEDPAIASAFEGFHDLVLAPGRVAGGLTAVVETPVEDAVQPLFADPPGCAMLKQADFAVPWMPDGTTIGPAGTVDWFLLPGEATGSVPILVGGDQVVQFRRGPQVDALMAYLAGPEAGASWARRGGYLSPKSTIPDDVYPTDYLGELAAVLRSASTLAFDASDQMPPDIGSGLLWREITRWVAGTERYEAFAARIDAARAAERAAPGSPGG